MTKMPDWASDAVNTNVDVTVSVVDRLRILFLGRFSMRVVAYTEYEVGRATSESMFIAPRFRTSNRDGYATVELQSASCIVCGAPHFDGPGTDGTVSLAEPPVGDHQPAYDAGDTESG